MVIYFNYVHMHVSVVMCIYMHVAKKVRWYGTPRQLDTPRSRVTRSCESPDVGARNQFHSFMRVIYTFNHWLVFPAS